MTTPSTDIGLSNVQTEFGGSNPVAISEYYRGGSLVGSGTAAGTSGNQIATSGEIKLGDFRAVTAFNAALLNSGAYTMSGADTVSLYGTTLGIQFNTDGTITMTRTHTSTGGSGSEDVPTGWGSPTGGSPGNNYWIEYHLNSGSGVTSSPGVDTWLQLSSARNFVHAHTGTGSISGVWRFRIASDSGGSNILATFTVTISIEDGPP
jgi:hypothetical protein